VLQCVAVCCGVLQCVAVCCSVLQCVAVCCSVLQCVIVNEACLSVAMCCSVLQCVVVNAACLNTACRTLQRTHAATHTTALQHHTLQHTLLHIEPLSPKPSTQNSAVVCVAACVRCNTTHCNTHFYTLNLLAQHCNTTHCNTHFSLLGNSRNLNSFPSKVLD